jgi:hypothetical protein
MNKLKFFVGVAIAAGALSSQAMALDYGVSTAARAQDASVSLATYRTGTDSSGNYTRPGDTPSNNYDTCATGGSIIYCAATHSTTSDPSYSQTASTSSVSLADQFLGEASPLQGSAFAWSDLSKGSVGAEAIGKLRGGYNGIGADAYAQFSDVLDFSIAGATSTTLTDITVDVLLDGAISAPGPYSVAGMSYGVGFGDASSSFSLQSVAGVTSTYGPGYRNWKSATWTAGPSGWHFTGIYTLTGAAQALGVSSSLGVSAAGGESLFGHTAAMTFLLPDNVTFTSHSGTFLSALTPSTAVPEPATWAMMLAGFGLVGSALRRRQSLSTLRV